MVGEAISIALRSRPPGRPAVCGPLAKFNGASLRYASPLRRPLTAAGRPENFAGSFGAQIGYTSRSTSASSSPQCGLARCLGMTHGQKVCLIFPGFWPPERGEQANRINRYRGRERETRETSFSSRQPPADSGIGAKHAKLMQMGCHFRPCCCPGLWSSGQSTCRTTFPNWRFSSK